MPLVTMPRTYREWKDCIERDGTAQISPEFVATRIIILSDDRAEETRAFRGCYGDAYLCKVIAWFQLLQAEMRRSAH
jgi:hypothetical protein